MFNISIFIFSLTCCWYTAAHYDQYAKKVISGSSKNDFVQQNSLRFYIYEKCVNI